MLVSASDCLCHGAFLNSYKLPRLPQTIAGTEHVPIHSLLSGSNGTMQQVEGTTDLQDILFHFSMLHQHQMLSIKSVLAKCGLLVLMKLQKMCWAPAWKHGMHTADSVSYNLA